FEAAVAEDAAALADEVCWFDVAELERGDFARQRQRTRLQKSELVRYSPRRVEADRELDLDRRARAFGADAQQVIHNLGEVEQPVIQNRRKRQQSNAAARDTVIDDVVFGRIGRADRNEGGIGL